MSESVAWWKEQALYQKLRNFSYGMAALCKLVGDNAQLERTFNYLRRIHSPQRGALGPRTVDKLVYVAANTAFLKKQIFEKRGMKEALFKLKRKEDEKRKLDREYITFEEEVEETNELVKELGGDYSIFEDAVSEEEVEDDDDDKDMDYDEEEDEANLSL